jgi:ABC-type glycerol-3-phosphate transport system substrate-binding protein
MRLLASSADSQFYLISRITVLACLILIEGEAGMKPFFGQATALALGVLASIGGSAAGAADKPYQGVTLNLASQNDQFAAVLAGIAPEFEALTGAKVNVDILSYPELLTKITADYVGHTKGYDLATIDIVWSGQFAEAGYTVDLADWIKRDAAEIKVEDIYPSLMSSLGGYKGKQVAFPFAGYANVLAYRKDLYEAAGLKAPETMEDFVVHALKLTDKSKKAFGFVANGQKGPAVAQDWMQYNRQFGGSILDKDGKPTLNSTANIASVIAYKKLFDDAAPPGAADYDWGGREEAAWAFIKWVTSPAVHKDLNLRGAGSYLRKSETTDPELLAKYPFLPVIATSFEHGDGDFRPRIPQYPELQDLIGGAINAVLVGQADPKTAMDDIQAKAEALFK